MSVQGSRFHPIEIGLSMLYKMLVILILGPVVIGVFIFEIIVSSSSMFNHANVKLPLWLDRVLRVFGSHARHAPGASFDRKTRD